MTAATLELPLAPSVPTLDEVQAFAIDRVLALWDEGRPGCFLNMATGTGKTHSTTLFIKQARQRTGGLILFLCHREELVGQAVAEFRDAGLEVAIEQAEHRALTWVRAASHTGRPFDVVVASKDSMQGGRLADWPADSFAAIVYDEAHLAIPTKKKKVEGQVKVVPTTWGAIRQHFAGAGFHLFLTATAYRLDGRPLYGVPGSLVETPGDRRPFPLEGIGPGKPVAEAIAFKYPIQSAIANGHLVDIKAVPAMVGVDLRGVRTSRLTNDFNVGDLEDRLSKQLEPIVNEFKRQMRRLGLTRCLALWPDVGSCRAAATAFVQVGIRSKAVHGHSKRYPMPPSERKSVIRQYRHGDVEVLSSCELLTTGFNDPATQAILMARPTKSLGLFCQIIGRVSRTHPTKKIGYVIGLEWSGAEGIMSTLDMFLEDEPDPRVREIARKLGRLSKGDVRPSELIDEARKIRERDEEEDRRRAALATLRVRVKDRPVAHKFREFSPYSSGITQVLGVAPLPREPRPADAMPIHPGQADLLVAYGFPKRDVMSLSADQAHRLIDPIQAATIAGLATPKQVRRLIDEHGMTPDRARATRQHDAARLLAPVSAGLRFVLRKHYSDREIDAMSPAERGKAYGQIKARRA